MSYGLGTGQGVVSYGDGTADGEGPYGLGIPQGGKEGVGSYGGGGTAEIGVDVGVEVGVEVGVGVRVGVAEGVGAEKGVGVLALVTVMFLLAIGPNHSTRSRTIFH